MPKDVVFYDAGQKSYQQIWDLQHHLQKQKIDCKLAKRDGKTPTGISRDILLFVEHPHVYTLGKSGDKAHLLRSKNELEVIDAEFIETDRGGDITYHGPGQIVGYPIFDLDNYFTDIHKYMRYLEEIIIRTCNDFGVSAGRIDGLTGVWVDGAKVCAMGVRCSRWVTMHGFALNISPDLSYFSHIIPCGISDKQVTSLNEITGKEISQGSVKKRLKHHFKKQFDITITEVQSLHNLEMKATSSTFL